MKSTVTNPQASALVIVCYACCGDPQLVPTCRRCSGTGADPNPGRSS